MSGNSSLNIINEVPELYYTPVFHEFVIFSLMAVIGLVGNIVSCIIIVKNKEMHTEINCYLFSLAISDLIILFVLFPLNYKHLVSLKNDHYCKIRYDFFSLV